MNSELEELNAENISSYIESSEKQFKIFNIPYTEKELKCIKTFNLSTYDTYDNYGDNNFEDLDFFLNKIGSNKETKIKKMSKIIKKLTTIVTRGYKKESYWLTIRVTHNNTLFDIPRWHCDGYYIGFEYRDDLSKFATVLKGPGTLFIKTNDEDRNNFISIRNDEQKKSIERNGPNVNSEDDEYRKQMALKIKGDHTQLNNNQAVIFMSGNEKICGIHSEPEMHEPRIFLSIVPGSHEEIDKWKNRRVIRKTKMIGGTDIYYLKYLKYKQKYEQLKILLKIDI